MYIVLDDNQPAVRAICPILGNKEENKETNCLLVVSQCFPFKSQLNECTSLSRGFG